MNIVYKMIHHGSLIIINRKESVYDNENKLTVSIMDSITIIYNCDWFLLIIIPNNLSNKIKRNNKRIY